jgi:hypothetical protein
MFTHQKKTEERETNTASQLYEISECIAFFRKKKKEEKNIYSDLP